MDLSHSTKFGFKESESVDVNVKEKPAKLELNNSFGEAKACAKFWVIVFATAALMLSMRFLLGSWRYYLNSSRFFIFFANHLANFSYSIYS